MRDDWLVLRAGQMYLSDLTSQARKAETLINRLSISVWSADTDDPVTLAQMARAINPNVFKGNWAKPSTFGRLRLKGYRLLPTDDDYHYSLMLPEITVPVIRIRNDADLEAACGRLTHHFDAPVRVTPP